MSRKLSKKPAAVAARQRREAAKLKNSPAPNNAPVAPLHIAPEDVGKIAGEVVKQFRKAELAGWPQNETAPPRPLIEVNSNKTVAAVAPMLEQHLNELVELRSTMQHQADRLRTLASKATGEMPQDQRSGDAGGKPMPGGAAGALQEMRHSLDVILVDIIHSAGRLEDFL